MTCVQIRIVGNSTTGQGVETGYAHAARHICGGMVNCDPPCYCHRSGRVLTRNVGGTSANARNGAVAHFANAAIGISRITARTGSLNSAGAHQTQRRRYALSASGARHATCDQNRNAVCALTTGNERENSDRKHWTPRSAKSAGDLDNSSRKSLSRAGAGHAMATGGITARRKNDRRICGGVGDTDTANAGIRRITK